MRAPLLAALPLVLLAACGPGIQQAGMTRRQAAVEAHPEWPAEVKADVLASRVGPGMPAEAVLAAWGPPSRVFRTTTADGVREQWAYGWPPPVLASVYLDNGIVVAVQR